MTYRILTVCTGNICRSPMAEVVLAQHLDQAGLDAEVDSAATTSYEVGNPIDPRGQQVLRDGGYPVPARQARQITAEDLVEFDLILAMTREHKSYIDRLVQRSGLADGAHADVRLYREFCSQAPTRGSEMDVPDPWYGGHADFVETLETIEDGAVNVVARVQQELDA